MRDTIFLRFDRSGVSGMTKRQPALAAGEFAVQLHVEVDDNFFRQITPEARIYPGGTLFLRQQIGEVTAEEAPRVEVGDE